MPSQARLDREASARFVMQSLITHRELVEAGVKKALQPYAEKDEAVPDVGPLLDFLCRALRSSTAAVAKSDDAHENEAADDLPPRLARDESTTALRGSLLDLKGALDSMGAPVIKRFGLQGTIAEKPSEVLTIGKYVLANLENKTLEWPVRRGVSVDRAVYVQDIRGHVEALEAALKAVTTEAKELDATKVVKDGDLNFHDKTFGLTAGVSWELFKLAGQLELAERIKPSTRRPGQTEVDPPKEKPEPT